MLCHNKARRRRERSLEERDGDLEVSVYFSVKSTSIEASTRRPAADANALWRNEMEMSR